MNISAAMVAMLVSGKLQQAKIQLGQYFQIEGLWVGVIFLVVVPVVFGAGALWAYRRSEAVSESTKAILR